MALTNTPAWPQIPRYDVASVTTANPSTDGSGMITALLTAGSDGTRVTGLYAGATTTVTATAVRFFLSTDGGTSWVNLPRLDALVPDHTISDTTANAGRVAIIDQDEPARFFDLPGSSVLGFAIAVSVAGGEMVIEALGADY